MPLPVLWQDEHLIVIDKPAGMPTLPDGYDAAAPNVRASAQVEFGRIWVVHRLDKETSGVLMLARSAAAHRGLNAQFEAHTVTKIYHALARGVPAWDDLTLDRPLRPDGDRRHRTVIDAVRGKAAITHVRVLQRFADCALLEARPETGRTHQIRAHLAHAGYPLIGDELYGGEKTIGLGRTALHAYSIACQHPLTLAVLNFVAPYPADIAQALEDLAQPR